MKLTICFILFFLNLHADKIIDLSNEPLLPIEKKIVKNSKKLHLGEKLFSDKRLSKDNSISCMSCHNIEFGGADFTAKSFGVNGSEGELNSPTVLNSSLNFVQFWDGRVRTLEEQVNGPIHNPLEMATNWDEIVNKIKKDTSYKKLFDTIYDGKIIKENIIDAIVYYEESLITPSRFDEFLMGNKDAISNEEFLGYELFKSYGCASCHQGKNIGGNFYEKLGVFNPYPFENTKNDLGRYRITGIEQDKYEFKVPSLRNVILTSPYLHNGKIKKLEDVISIMAKYQLGRDIPFEDIKMIKAFLKSLTSKDIEAKYDNEKF